MLCDRELGQLEGVVGLATLNSMAQRQEYEVGVLAESLRDLLCFLARRYCAHSAEHVPGEPEPVYHVLYMGDSQVLYHASVRICLCRVERSIAWRDVALI